MGMLSNKDLHGFLEPFAGSGAHIHAVPVSSHEHHDPQAILKAAADAGFATGACAGDAPTAIAAIGQEQGPAPVVLIGGSLYLAGRVLEANGTLPS